MPADTCYHCGEPIPAGINYTVTIFDAPRAMCCLGCQAIAQTIIDGGLSNYYRHRSATPPKATELIPDELKLYQNYDEQDIQQEFVASVADLNEVILSIEGISCAACAWLIEKHLYSIKGIKQIHVNSASHRATIKWRRDSVELSTILQQIHQLGYRAAPFNPDQQEQAYQAQLKAYLKRIGVAGLASMQVMMFAIALYGDLISGMSVEYRNYFRWVSLIMATPVLLYSAQPFYASAWRSLRAKSLVMDVPVSLALIGAYLASALATIRGSGEVYFESVSMFTLLLLTGRMLELRTRRQASLISANQQKLIPELANRLMDNGQLEVVPAKKLKLGDKIRIKPGETVPCDGKVIEGCSQLNEAMLTGESLPVSKGVGDSAYSGSVNHQSPLTLQVTAIHQGTLMATILRLQEQALNEKPKIATLADQTARYFIAVLLCVALMTFCFWSFNDNPDAFWITISVLVASCPCALSLATPTALTVATARLSQGGFLVKRGHVLEQLAKLKVIISDKTGTLTSGDLSLAQFDNYSSTEDEQILRWIAAIESHTNHPIQHAFKHIRRVPAAVEVEVFPGQGLLGEVDGHQIKIGSAHFCQTPAEPKVGLIELLILIDGQLAARAYLSDKLKTDAIQFSADLKQSNIQLSILSGDNYHQVQQVASELAVRQFKASALPSDKLEWLQQQCLTQPNLMMMGDGVNDAPVLAAAPLSIAIGHSADLAKISADAVLLGDKLKPLTDAIFLARQCRKIIRQNLAWSLGYNGMIVPLAAAGMVTPYIAVIGMSLSSFLVLANSLRLGR